MLSSHVIPGPRYTISPEFIVWFPATITVAIPLPRPVDIEFMLLAIV
nr:MAG TPA: hypothetical protein [Caudoviricetes sp.]